MGIPTINTIAITPAGPLAKFIKDTIFVSGVTADDIAEAENDVKEETAETESNQDVRATKSDSPEAGAGQKNAKETDPVKAASKSTKDENFFLRLIDAVGNVAGDFVNRSIKRDVIQSIR
ncbi:hypothetical protein AAULR_24771, partial [Lacticaseibacillus rhamnosus MTCC 5462]